MTKYSFTLSLHIKYIEHPYSTHFAETIFLLNFPIKQWNLIGLYVSWLNMAVKQHEIAFDIAQISRQPYLQKK